ncbi:MAG: hypothetical protein ACOYN4_01520 [Bacteroidales bacterium]
MKKLFFALCLLAAGCSSTSIVNSWKAPGATYSPDKYKKTLVVVLAKDEQARKSAEDMIASNFKALNVSYPLFTTKQLGDDTLKVKNMIKEQGYDALLVMRLLTTKAKSTFVQGGFNQAYVQNGIYYFGDYVKSGSYATDVDYIVSSNFFSLKDEKLLWSGVTASTNPKKLDKLIKEVANEVVFKMKEDKFLPEK